MPTDTPSVPGEAGAPRARDLMTTDVLTVPPGMPVEVLARLLAERHVSGVPVVEGATGALLGLVTEADLLHRLADPGGDRGGFFAALFRDPDRLAERYARAHGTTARDVMTPAPLASVAEDTPAAEIAKVLDARGVRRVPVLRDGKLVGIVSRADLLRAVLQALRPAEHGAASDARIEHEIRGRMREEPWADTHWASVQVRDGVVELHGFCRSDAVRRALRVLAEQVAGVRRVEDLMEEMPYDVYAYGAA